MRGLRCRTRRPVSVILFLLLVGALAPAIAATPAAAAPGDRIMVIGDSISQGLEGDFTWRYRIAQHLSGTGVDFVGPWTGTTRLPAQYPPGWPEEGVPPVRDGAYRPGIGFDSQHLAQWGWQMHQAKDAVRAQVGTYAPTHLLIELGFNDLGWGVNNPAGVLNDLRTLLANARAAKPDVKVVVANVVHRTPLSNLPNLPGIITEYNGLLAGAIAGLSTASSPVALADIDAPFDEYRDTYDGLHPNVRGEYVIAKAFADTLSTRFGLGGGYGPIPTSLPADLSPGPPSSITTTTVGIKVRVSWSHVFGASGYQFFYRDATMNKPFEPLPLPIGADSWLADLLPAGHRMEFYVRTMRGEASLSTPSPVAVANVPGLPAVPNLRLSTSADRPHEVTLAWDPVAGSDDYHVYAAPGCDLLPPPNEQFELVQWSLGSRTTWTHGLITATCMNYFVVASRYGGEGARPAFGSRAVPYLPNYSHFLARYRYYDDAAVDTGDRVARTNVGAGTDRGVVLARAYIRNNDWFTEAIGDHRSWSTNPFASSKVTFAWDTRTGEVAVYVHKSCAIGASFPSGPIQTLCRDALPIAFVADAASVSDDNTDQRNFVSVARTASGGLSVGMAAINAWDRICIGPVCAGPGFGRINARATLEPSGGSFTARLVADKFPAWEFIRYPHYVQAAPLGENWVIGTRDQTTIGDLRGSPSSCVSVPPETRESTRPMSC